MPRVALTVLFFCASVLVCSASSESRVALVIGNANYDAASGLPNAARDADLIAKTLLATGITDVTLAKDLNRDNLIATLRAFASKADAADWAIIYYAGHGIEVAGENYLIPIDAKLANTRDISFETVGLQQVLQTTENARTLSLIILDACRDNPFAASISGKDRTRSIGRGLAAVEPSGATAVFYSAKGGTTAADGEGLNSPFAQALAKELLTPGLEINMLFRRVRQDVFTSSNRQQEPFMYGSLPPSEFYFIPPSRSSAAEQAAGLTLGDSTFEMFGLRLTPLSPELKHARGYEQSVDGIAVDAVLPSFAEAYTSNIGKGDVIVEVNEKAVRNATEFRLAIADAEALGRGSVLLVSDNEGQVRFTTLRRKQ